MRKIFSCWIIALFAAVSMNAQTKVQAEDGAFDINQPDAQKWGGTWYDFEPEGTKGNFDASTYDYVWIKFSGNTGKFRFGITYNEWKSTEAWAETFFDEVKYIEDAEGIVFTKLEKEKTYEFGGPDKAASPYAGDTWDKHIQNVYTQDDGAPVNVKVEGIWFGTAAELKAALRGGSSEGGEEGGSEGGEEGGEEPVAGDWGAVIFNGDCEGEDAGCLLSKDGNDMDNFKWNVKEGAGVGGSKCATVYATGTAENEWDAQFFIYAKDYVFKAGDKFKFSMMIKADKEAESSPQAHVAPRSYLHYTIIGGPVKFTTEWAEYKFEGEVPAEADGMQTIAFNLNQDKTLENNYYFDNISWEVEGAPTAGAEIEFSIDGVTYHGSSSDQTALVKSVDTSMSILEIPESVSYEGVQYQVSGIDDNAFSGCTMAALIWDAEAPLPSKAFNNASIDSNFLLYVRSASYAPSSVMNVIVDGTAQSIVLSDDGGQFYCPQAFTAHDISYTHYYSMETGGDGMGWETLALPFDVQKISHGIRGEIIPFALFTSTSSQKPFWLATFSGNSFKRASSIQANEPYIIAMPNSGSYRNDYILAGNVTFSAENTRVSKTPTFSGKFVPTYAAVPKSSSVYALNVVNKNVSNSGGFDAGSLFISNLRDVQPFEAYMSAGSSTRGIIEIGFDDCKTDLDQISLSKDESREVVVHTISGRKVGTSLNGRLDETIEQLPKGVYIVNGKKIVK